MTDALEPAAGTAMPPGSSSPSRAARDQVADLVTWISDLNALAHALQAAAHEAGPDERRALLQATPSLFAARRALECLVGHYQPAAPAKEA